MERFLRALPRRPPSAFVRYALTTGLVGACFLIVVALQDRAGLLAYYVLFPAVFAAAIVFDRGSGLYAALLSTVLLVILLWLDRGFVPRVFVFPIALFAILAAGLAIVSEGLRTALERALAAERAKDLLLVELGHRTKNNLAIVASLLSLQLHMKPTAEARAALEDAISRIHAIASVHSFFDPNREEGAVDLQRYLEKLCLHLEETLGQGRPIAVRVEADSYHLRTEKAVSLGLIVNELVTNAFKHAFPDNRSGTIMVRANCGSSLDVVVEDNGVGCPANRKNGLGSRLTGLLAKQLAARVKWEDGNPGCRACVEIPAP